MRTILAGFLFFGGAFLSPLCASRLTVTFFDCGQGDASLLLLPNGAVALIDAGPLEFHRPFQAGRDIIAPHLDRLGISTIDFAVISHAHLDHYGGFLYLIDRYAIGEIVEPGLPREAGLFSSLMLAAEEKGLLVRVPQRGENLPWDGSLQVRVLHPPQPSRHQNPNDSSLVIRLSHGEVSFLFTGDATRLAEFDMLLSAENLFSAEVLKVAHHGSRGSSTEEFLRAVNPRWAVISAGEGNVYRHPHKETLERLFAVGAETISVKEAGDITFVSDGKKIRREKSRGRNPFWRKTGQ